MTNVVFLLMDALRYDHFTKEITPNLVKIAQEGFNFKNMLAGNTATLKSIPCILSSSFKYDHKENSPTILQKEGYLTAAFHSNPIFGDHFSEGFQICEDLHTHTPTSNRRVKKLARKLLPHAIFTKIKEAVRNVSDSEKYLPYMRAKEKLQIVSEWMNATSDPYFLWVHLMDPHLPYYPRDIKEMSRDELIKFNDKIIEAAHKRTNLTKEEIELAKNLYRKEISEMDEAIGNFVKNVNRDNIFIFTSDHGEEFGEYGDFSHHEDKFIPPLLHVPMVITGKGINPKIQEKYCSHLEISQLIFQMLDVEQKIGIWKNIA